jgi:hypothetical protein
MARIRSIKPELRTSLAATEWPREVRYFWVLLWGYLDDHGYGVDEPRLIKPDCFPLDDDLTVSDIDKWLDLITASGSLCRYEVGGRRYLHAPKWAEHQRPQHPARPKMPDCPHLIHPHEALMNGSHVSLMRGSGEPHETSGQMTVPGVDSAGQVGDRPTSGDSPGGSGESHETLTPEGVVEQGAGSREQGAGNARARPAASLLANSLLDEHRRHYSPSLPREVAKRVGMQIDNLLDDPEISPDEISEALRRLREKPNLGPGILPSLVNEVRQEQAHPELARQRRRASNGHVAFQNPADPEHAYEGTF